MATVFFPSTREALDRWPGTRPFTIGPPPRNEPERPWLRNGAVADPSRRGPRTLADPPSHLRARPTSASPPPAAWPRSRARGGGGLNRPPPAPETSRAGPCDERSLPLTRQSLRAEAKLSPCRRGSTARPWLPPSEWNVSRQRDAIRNDGRKRADPVPLGGFSPRVVRQCEAQAEQREPMTTTWRATDGGWASEMPINSDAPTESSRDHRRRAWDEDTTRWSREPDTVPWRQHVVAIEQPRGTLALVDRFLRSDVAAAFLPADRPQ